MFRHRLSRLLAAATLFVGLSGIALAVTAAPVNAAPANVAPANAAPANDFDCSVSVDAPWHSPYSNRVYFNGGVHCWGDLPNIIQLYNEGAGRNGNIQVSTRKTCSQQYDCYSDGGVTYIAYQGPGQYCGVIEANVSSDQSAVRHYYAGKRCVQL